MDKYFDSTDTISYVNIYIFKVLRSINYIAKFINTFILSKKYDSIK